MLSDERIAEIREQAKTIDAHRLGVNEFHALDAIMRGDPFESNYKLIAEVLEKSGHQ